MITVQIDEEQLLEMLMDGLRTWTSDDDTLELFEQYYDSMVYGGCFDGAELNIMSIVDNDFINNTTIVEREEYEKDRNEYLRNGIKKFIEEEKGTYEDKEDFKADLKDKIKELKEEAPEFDDLERGENISACLNGHYIEATTDFSLLIS